MRSSRITIEDRRNRLLCSLRSSGTVNIKEIAEELDVSPLTIRRDLDALEVTEGINRFYSGAKIGKTNGEANIFSSPYMRSKHAIACYAAKLVEDGDTIFINTSSTALAMIPMIKARHVTIITNNAKALEIEIPPNINLLFTGGEIRFPKEAMVGEFATNNLNMVTASKCFLGCNGITVHEGVTTAVMHEASINHLMLTRVMGSRYILADKTKIGKKLNFIYGTIKEVTMLITDTEAPQDRIAEFKDHIEVKQVDACL